MQYRINLVAGVPQRVVFTGRTIVLMDLGAADQIDMEVEIAGFSVESLRGLRRGFRLRAEGFGGAIFTSAVNTTLQVVVSNADISVNYVDGAQIDAVVTGAPTVTIEGQTVQINPAVLLPVTTENRVVKVQEATPIAVVPDRGAPGNPVYVSGITYSDAPATSIVDNAAVAVTDAGAAILAADPDRKAVRFANVGADPVTLGAVGITWAKRVIVLDPGDMWTEDKAANLAWAAITDAGKTASITAQEVLA